MDTLDYKTLATTSDIKNLGIDTTKLSPSNLDKLLRTVAYYRMTTSIDKPFSKTDGYLLAFEGTYDPSISRNSAAARACSIEKNTSYKTIASYMTKDIDLLFASDRTRVLQEMASIALGGTYDRDKIAAAKVFLEHTAPPELLEKEDNTDEVLVDIIEAFTEKLNDKVDTSLPTIGELING